MGSEAPCAEATLAWDQNSEPDVAGYRVHYGIFSGDYDHALNAGAFASCIISGLQEGITYYFSATAYDSQNNESNYSEEVSFTIPLADSGDDGSGAIDPPPGEVETPPADSDDVATAAVGEAASSDSSSSCFIGTCAPTLGFLKRILGGTN